MGKLGHLNFFNKETNGFTVLEIFIVLSILSYLCMIAIPNFNLLYVRQEQDIVLDRLKQAISFAKNEAFLRKKVVSLCGSRDNQIHDKDFYCNEENDWSGGFIIFENETAEKLRPIKADKIIKKFPGVAHGKLEYDFGGKTQLNIFPNGRSMTMDIGHFIYKPKKGLDNFKANKVTCNRVTHCH